MTNHRCGRSPDAHGEEEAGEAELISLLNGGLGGGTVLLHVEL